MASPTDGKPLGGEMLEAVTQAMVAIHERYHRRTQAGECPYTADGRRHDRLSCSASVYTDVEKTMIELQRPRRSCMRPAARPAGRWNVLFIGEVER